MTRPEPLDVAGLRRSLVSVLTVNPQPWAWDEAVERPVDAVSAGVWLGHAGTVDLDRILTALPALLDAYEAQARRLAELEGALTLFRKFAEAIAYEHPNAVALSMFRAGTARTKGQAALASDGAPT